MTTDAWNMQDLLHFRVTVTVGAMGAKEPAEIWQHVPSSPSDKGKWSLNPEEKQDWGSYLISKLRKKVDAKKL